MCREHGSIPAVGSSSSNTFEQNQEAFAKPDPAQGIGLRKSQRSNRDCAFCLSRLVSPLNLRKQPQVARGEV